MEKRDSLTSQLEKKGYVRDHVMQRWVKKESLESHDSTDGTTDFLNIPPFGITDAMLEERLDEEGERG